MSQDAIVLPCPSCGTRNRVPWSRRHDRPVCADCRAPLPADRPAALDERSFDAFVRASALPVVVDFWAPWCGPCRAMAPHFERAAHALAGQAVFAKVNTEENPGLATRFSIQGIPTMVLLVGGREAARTSGAMQAGQIEHWVRAHAADATRAGRS